MKILLGVIGAVLGLVAAVLLLELGGFGNRADPIMSGLIALLVIGPIGAVAGAVLGTKLAMSLRREQDATAGGGLAKNSLKSLAVVVGLVAIAGTLYYACADATATPWLNPNDIGLTGKAPHTAELGRWEAHPDGSEIRYRANGRHRIESPSG